MNKNTNDKIKWQVWDKRSRVLSYVFSKFGQVLRILTNIQVEKFLQSQDVPPLPTQTG